MSLEEYSIEELSAELARRKRRYAAEFREAAKRFLPPGYTLEAGDDGDLDLRGPDTQVVAYFDESEHDELKGADYRDHAPAVAALVCEWAARVLEGRR